jgi:hypothetical protein
MSKVKEFGLYATCLFLALIAVISQARPVAGEKPAESRRLESAAVQAAVPPPAGAPSPSVIRRVALRQRGEGGDAARPSGGGGGIQPLGPGRVVPPPYHPWGPIYPVYPIYPAYPPIYPGYYPTFGPVPFQQQIEVDFSFGENQSTNGFLVPVGQQLVIEYVTGGIDVLGGGIVQAFLVTTANGVTVSHRLPLGPAGKSLYVGEELLGVNEQLRIYADGGSTANITLLRSGWDGSGTGTFTLSGMLNPMAQAIGPVGP